MAEWVKAENTRKKLIMDGRLLADISWERPGDCWANVYDPKLGHRWFRELFNHEDKAKAWAEDKSKPLIRAYLDKIDAGTVQMREFVALTAPRPCDMKTA